MTSAKGPQPVVLSHTTACPEEEATMERILQEVSAVGRRLEGMDSAISSLAAETKSICLDIVGFQSCVSGLEQRVATVEDHLNPTLDRDQKLLYLRSTLIYLEDRSHVSFFGFLEQTVGKDTQAFLRNALHTLMSLTFDPLLEFQRVHRLGPKRQDGASRSHPIIVGLLRHGQACQFHLAVRSHGPFRTEGI
ncbi:hypothetical protein NDU88_009306 [Pleurodeles waltl]|uniref:Uncharacterized protein n=1 Tax=Pleurodeles waltl TaxID=8319 RepID=A0AAV7PRQ4_PLEWA|nr:hypothetical protein NDU88_009306 [Pleurodeles waltl]